MKPKNQPNSVEWEEDIFTLRADVAQVKANRDEFMLLFGAARSDQPNKGELRVDLRDQVLLSPFSAKRLLAQLQRMARQYETTFGSLDERAGIRGGLLPTPPIRPPAFRSKEAAQKVEGCFRLLDRLNIRPAFERSFKVKEKTLLKNRFLLGFEKRAIQGDAGEKIMDASGEMGMPSNLRTAFLKHLPEANVVGFGFGENEETCIARAYLEFGVRYYRAMKDKPHGPDPYLSHLGFKWDVSDPDIHVVTRYTCYPGYTPEEMLKSVSGDRRAGQGKDPCKIVEGILDLATKKSGKDQFLFLKVDEENQPRNSFDVNVYSANLQMKEIHPFLLDLMRLYSIPQEQFQDLLESNAARILGHIAGGTDRKGCDFFTVYYGE